MRSTYGHRMIISKFLFQDKIKLVSLTLIILIGVLISMVIPYSFGKIIDYIVIKDLGIAAQLIVLNMFLNLIQSIASILEEWLGNIISLNCTNRIKQHIFSKVMDTKYEFLNFYKEGELVSRIDKTGGHIVSFYIEFLTSIVMVGLSVIISIYIMISISLKLFVLAILLFPLTYAINHKFKETIINKQRDYIEKTDEHSVCLIDSISNITGIKLSNIKNVAQVEYYEKIENLKNATMSNLNISLLVRGLQDLVTLALSTAIIFISSKLIIDGALTLGSIVAFNSYLDKLNTSIKRIIDLNLAFNEVIVDLERFQEIENYDKEQNNGNSNVLKVNSLELKNVSFKYVDEYVLKNCSIEINEPGLYAITGENGSGKTTIFNLLSKLYTKYEGEILINGVEIGDYNDEDLRNEVLYIESKPFILHGSLVSNIKLLNNEKINTLMIDEVIQFIDLEDKKYELSYSIKGHLSRGEKQKILLGRVLISNHSLFLLDELVSGLDGGIKRKVISKMKDRSKTRIIIIISHDVEVLKECDKIFILDNKNTRIEGSHLELIKKSKEYKKLFNG